MINLRPVTADADEIRQHRVVDYDRSVLNMLCMVSTSKTRLGGTVGGERSNAGLQKIKAFSFL
jgi:hypothetical protein